MSPVKIFFHDKPYKILVGLKRGKKAKYTSLISKDIDCTYSHTAKILNLLEDHGLIEFEKTGRKKLVKLTSLGEELANAFEIILEKLENLEKRKAK
jgi:predicted transcriptional regulator